MSLSIWQLATNNTEKLHPKCEGKVCGSYELCNNDTKILMFGCIYYTEEIEDEMIDSEVDYELNKLEGDTKWQRLN